MGEDKSTEGGIQGAIEAAVMVLHRRNGGQAERLDFSKRLLDPSLRLDSLDLAEIMVELERRFGSSPFDGHEPPRTWSDVATSLARRSIQIDGDDRLRLL